MTSSNERLKQLESIEQELSKSLHSAGLAIQELSKDKPSLKQVETHSMAFVRSLEKVEVDISKQITYLNKVSTGSPHEGSAYASQKVLNMAWHRLEHSKTQIKDLESMKNRHQQEQHSGTTTNQ